MKVTRRAAIGILASSAVAAEQQAEQIANGVGIQWLDGAAPAWRP